MKRPSDAQMFANGEWDVPINWSLGFLTVPECLLPLGLDLTSERFNLHTTSCTPPREETQAIFGNNKGTKIVLPGLYYPTDNKFQFKAIDTTDDYVRQIWNQWVQACAQKTPAGQTWSYDQLICDMVLRKSDMQGQDHFQWVIKRCFAAGSPENEELTSDGQNLNITELQLTLFYQSFKAGRNGETIEG